MNYYLNRLNNELSLLDEGSSILSTFFDTVTRENKLLRTDIIEEENQFVLNMEVPGFKKENIKISVNQKYLTILMNRKVDKNVKYLTRERFEGEFTRTFYIGNIDKESITAKVEDGVLTITLPKKEVGNETTEIAIN